MHRKKIVFPILLIVILALSGCGQAGIWEDDSKNWERVFRSQKPEDVNIIHSWYWRSPHFTYEFQYFFEIEGNEELNNQLFSENNLEQVEELEAKTTMIDALWEKPDWFIPKDVDEYDIYIFTDEPDRYFRVFIDKGSGNIFLTDYQL